MKTSLAGIALITYFEKSCSFPYRDSKGLWTCGVGHLMAASDDTTTPWSEEKIASVLAADLEHSEKAVLSTGVPLTQAQFDALVSLTFNIGSGAFAESTVARDLRKLRYFEAAEAFLLWDDHGRAVKRRGAERGVFLYGTAP